MHATIDVRFTISIDEDKTVPLAALAEFVTEQNVESVLLESMVESLDAARVEALCGEKHAHGNGDQRFQRAGTDTRTAVTTAGEHEFDLHYVEDTAADNDESSYFRPVEDVLSFDGQNRYQQDIAAKSVDLATSLSYRDAADHGDGISERMPSPTTINRRAKEYGSKLKQFLPDCVADTDADAVIPDGTKCHSQDDDQYIGNKSQPSSLLTRYMTDDNTDTDPTDDDRPRCGNTDTGTGDPCRRVVSDPSEQCFMHSGDGPPDDHGAPPPTMHGNTNAVKDAAYMSYDRRLESFDAKQKSLFTGYFRDFARKAENQLSAVQLATAAVVRDTLADRLLKAAQDDDLWAEEPVVDSNGNPITDPDTGESITRDRLRPDVKTYTKMLGEIRLGKKYEGINDNQQTAAAAHSHGNISLLWGDSPDDCDGDRRQRDGD
jgi:hypothetical protein